jgi:hypothetical protein
VKPSPRSCSQPRTRPFSVRSLADLTMLCVERDSQRSLKQASYELDCSLCLLSSRFPGHSYNPSALQDLDVANWPIIWNFHEAAVPIEEEQRSSRASIAAEFRFAKLRGTTEQTALFSELLPAFWA